MFEIVAGYSQSNLAFFTFREDKSNVWILDSSNTKMA
jgi:hypothetical protein